VVFGDLGTLNFKCPVEGPEKLKSAACNEILLLDQGLLLSCLPAGRAWAKQRKTFAPNGFSGN